MILSKRNLKYPKNKNIDIPDEALFNQPVKILQFGAGALLRGLPDYFVDKANRKGIFNGRIVVVKSTNFGNSEAFNQQDGLYTLVMKGIDNGQNIEEIIVCSAISHILSATENWGEILKEVLNPELKIIISNTTEVGIQFVEEYIQQSPPTSFPAKLLAILYERYKAFGGSNKSGFVIIPTELIPDNATFLKGIIKQLIGFNRLETAFENWVDENNFFCNSLVDRIIPGKPSSSELPDYKNKMNYYDDLLIVSESYRLWVIEGGEYIRSILSFEKADEGIIITPDISIYLELKLRLLNGTHTLSCALALLCEFETVKDALDNQGFMKFVFALMAEIAKAIPNGVNTQEANSFAKKILDRLRNPHISHLWINISHQYIAKLKTRVLPVLLEYYNKFNSAPSAIAMGFAAFIVYMCSIKKVDGQFFRERNHTRYLIQDDGVAYFFNLLNNVPQPDVVNKVLKDEAIWNTDLTLLPGFSEVVQKYLAEILAGKISNIFDEFV